MNIQPGNQIPHRHPGVFVRRRRTQITRVNQMRVTWHHEHGYHPYARRVPIRIDWLSTTTTTTYDEDVFVPHFICNAQPADNALPYSSNIAATKPNAAIGGYALDPAHVSMPKFGQSSTSMPSRTGDGIEAGDEHKIKRELPSSPALVWPYEGSPDDTDFPAVKKEEDI